MLVLLPRLALWLAVALPLTAAAQTGSWAQPLISNGPETSTEHIVSGTNNATYISGFTYDTMSLGTLRFAVARRLEMNGFVARLDAQGTPQWARPLASPASGTRALVTGLAADAQGNLLLCGTYSGGPLPLDAFVLPAGAATQGVVAKLDAAGTVLWARPLTAANGNNLYCTALTTDASGTVHVAIATGSVAPSAQTGIGVQQFSAAGVPGSRFDWPGVTTLPGSPYGGFATITKLRANPGTGQLGAVGEFFGMLTLRAASGSSPALVFISPPEPQRGAFVAGLAGTGEVQWAQQLSSLGLPVPGTLRTSYLNRLLGLAPLGTGFAVAGNYLGAGQLAGQPLAASGPDTTRAVLAHFDGQGQLQWHRLLETDGQPNSQLKVAALAEGGNGELHLGGTFAGTLAATSGGLQSIWISDLWLSRYSAQGQLLGSQHDGGDTTLQDMAVDSNGLPLVAGIYGLVGPVAGVPLPIAGGSMGFAARLGRTPLAVRAPGGPLAGLQVYPNPSAGASALQVAWPAAFGPVVLRLLDVLGREVRRQAVSAPTAALPVAGLPAGTYLLQVAGAAGRRCQRVVLQ